MIEQCQEQLPKQLPVGLFRTFVVCHLDMFLLGRLITACQVVKESLPQNWTLPPCMVVEEPLSLAQVKIGRKVWYKLPTKKWLVRPTSNQFEAVELLFFIGLFLLMLPSSKLRP